MPGTVRSGLFHEGKVYETDGEKAIGIHDPHDVVMLAPLGGVPSFRVFDTYGATADEQRLGYSYLNPAIIQGTESTINLPENLNEVGLEVRVAGVVTDRLTEADPHEAGSSVLGYTVAMVFTDPAKAGDEAWATQARDIGVVVGPFLVTPDELTAMQMSHSATSFEWPFRIDVNGEAVDSGKSSGAFSFVDLLLMAVETSVTSPGDLIAWPTLSAPELTSTIGRYLMPDDEIRVTVEGLGTLVARLGVR